MCLLFCFFLLWYSEAFHGLFSNLRGALACWNLLSWERGIQSQPLHVKGETKGRKESSAISTSKIHISRPDEALRAHLSPAVNSLSRSPPGGPLVLTENKQRGACVLVEWGRRGVHYSPSSWFLQLISTHCRASLGLFSALLCGQ